MRGPDGRAVTRTMQPFLIPDDFRAFMQQVVAYLDLPLDDKFLDAEDALQDSVGYGGRVDGADGYRFTYISPDGLYKWEVPLREVAIRDIADGLLIEVPAERREIVRTHAREPSGEPLLAWGEYREDALAITGEAQLLAALDGLHALARDAPRLVRLWSTHDDQVVAVIGGDECALYVVESLEGYGTSVGDRAREDRRVVLDHEGQPFDVVGADCVPWTIARQALAYFMTHGELGPHIEIDGRIPSVLLMMGDIDRRAALAARGAAPREVERSSLPRLATTPVPELVAHVGDTTVPHEIAPPLPAEELAAWARRLIEVLHARALLELGDGSLDEITYHLSGLLQAHGSEAQHSLDTADWLANEIGAVRGIGKLFATGGDLQIALRRARDPG